MSEQQHIAARKYIVALEADLKEAREQRDEWEERALDVALDVEKAERLVGQYREALERFVMAIEGQEICFLCGAELTQDNPQKGHIDLPDGSEKCDYLSLRELLSGGSV